MSSRPRKPCAIAELDRALGADRALALSHVAARHRPAIEALFRIDAAMGDVLRTTSDPMLGQIRLAWWRERLEELDSGAEAPAEPRLQAVKRELLPRGLKGSDLARLERGWVALFDPFPWDAGTAEAIWFRGRQLFALAATILASSDDPIEEAGGLWALVDVARHCSDAQSREMLLEKARTFAAALAGRRFSAALRPISGLGALAIGDSRRGEPLSPQGSFGRSMVMLRHRLSGRLSPR